MRVVELGPDLVGAAVAGLDREREAARSIGAQLLEVNREIVRDRPAMVRAASQIEPDVASEAT